MILSDRDIVAAFADGLEINPFEPSNLQPASVDLTLGAQFYTAIPDVEHAADPVDPLKGTDSGRFRYTGKRPRMILGPGAFCIAATRETVVIPADIQATVDGKSSLARCGLTIHQTGGFIDPGFNGTITLELSNVAPWPILLTVGMPICQVSFSRLLSASERPYGSPGLGSRYQGQIGATLAKGVLYGWQTGETDPT